MCSQFHNFQFGKRHTHCQTINRHFSLCNTPLTRVPKTSSPDLLQQLCFLQKLRDAFKLLKRMYWCTIPQFRYFSSTNFWKVVLSNCLFVLQNWALWRGTTPSWKRSSLRKWDTLFIYYIQYRRIPIPNQSHLRGK